MASLNKITPTSPSRQRPSELETSIAGALYDLESNIPDMKSALRPLQFVSAREVSNVTIDGATVPQEIYCRAHTIYHSSKSATARKPSSSSSPCLCSKASTRCSNGTLSLPLYNPLSLYLCLSRPLAPLLMKYLPFSPQFKPSY